MEMVRSNNGPGLVFDLDFSLMPSRSHESSCRLPNGGVKLEREKAITFDVSLNIGEVPREGYDIPLLSKKEGSQWKQIRTTCESPFSKVQHQVLVELIVQYQRDETPGDNAIPIAQEVLRFLIPLHFVVPSLPSLPFSPFNTCSSTSLASSPSSQNDGNQRHPYKKAAFMKIPAYSQLFYPNGDPRHNEWEIRGEPLPVYCK